MNWFKPHLEKLAAYPYRKVEARIKLDQNESPFDLPQEMKERALARLRDLAWNRYPDLHADGLREVLGKNLGWPAEGIVAAPGSNLLVLALAQAANRVLDTAPSFAYYQGAAHIAGARYEAHRLGESFALPLQALLDSMTEPPGALFLANPHAPTGRLFPEGEVRQLADRAAQTGWLLVIDEAYHQFSGSDHRVLAKGSPHVALLRTFSKAFALGGVRAGYMLAAPEVAARIQGMVPPFCLPAHTQAILEVVLQAPQYARERAARLAAERERIREALAKHPTWRPHPSATNFILVRTPDAAKAFEALVERGILLRRQDHLPGLEGCLRLSVGTREENDAFLAAAFEIAREG